MEGLIMAGQLILGLSILVTLHEFGHFITAKWFKMRVDKFYLFFDFLFPIPTVLNFALFKKKVGDAVGVSVSCALGICHEGRGIGGFYLGREPGWEVYEEGRVTHDVADEVEVELNSSAEFAGSVGGIAANLGGVWGLGFVCAVVYEGGLGFVVEEKSIFSSTGYEFV